MSTTEPLLDGKITFIPFLNQILQILCTLQYILQCKSSASRGMQSKWLSRNVCTNNTTIQQMPVA